MDAPEKTFTQADIDKAEQQMWRKCVNAVCSLCRASDRPPDKGRGYTDAPYMHGLSLRQPCQASDLWAMRPPVAVDENVKHLAELTGKDPAICAAYLEKEGGDFAKALHAIKNVKNDPKGY